MPGQKEKQKDRQKDKQNNKDPIQISQILVK